MAPIAAAIEEVPLILLCGRNEPLAARLRRQPARAPRMVVGYTPDVAHYMRMADFFIGKPGPGSLSEAVQLGLPVIVSRNAWTMPQERYNTVWVRERGLGVVVPGFRRVADGVQQLLADLPTYQAATRQVDNQAATAIPEVLERLLADRVAPDEVTACRLLAA
jgi:1,2-diacylglycerol 3-beta-galactosyltransferase